MAGTPSKGKVRRKLPAERLHDEWYAQVPGRLIPALLPLAERIMREAPSRIEVEQICDRWHAQAAAFMAPWLFLMP